MTTLESIELKLMLISLSVLFKAILKAMNSIKCHIHDLLQLYVK